MKHLSATELAMLITALEEFIASKPDVGPDEPETPEVCTAVQLLEAVEAEIARRQPHAQTEEDKAADQHRLHDAAAQMAEGRSD